MSEQRTDGRGVARRAGRGGSEAHCDGGEKVVRHPASQGRQGRRLQASSSVDRVSTLFLYLSRGPPVHTSALGPSFR